jgi:RNA polymerase sigma-70 factor (ECF subfamily)
MREAREPARRRRPAGGREQFGALAEANFSALRLRRAPREGREEVEDLTAEVFAARRRRIGAPENRGVPFSAWLLRTSANAVVDRARARSGRTPPPDPVEPSTSPSASTPTPVRGCSRGRELPADQRRRDLSCASPRSARSGDRGSAGRTEGAVKQLQLRALRGLRKRMDREDG